MARPCFNLKGKPSLSQVYNCPNSAINNSGIGPEFSPDTYEVREESVERLLRAAGADLKQKLPQGVGFTLLLFTFGPDGCLFYTSNANREDMIATMKEFIAKQEPHQ